GRGPRLRGCAAAGGPDGLRQLPPRAPPVLRPGAQGRRGRGGHRLHQEAVADHLHPEGRLAEGGGAASAGPGLPAGAQGRRLMLGPLLIALALAAGPAATPKKGKSKPATAKTAPAPADPSPATPPSASAATATPEKTDVTPGQKPKLGLDGMGRTPEEQKQL